MINYLVLVENALTPNPNGYVAFVYFIPLFFLVGYLTNCNEAKRRCHSRVRLRLKAFLSIAYGNAIRPRTTTKVSPERATSVLHRITRFQRLVILLFSSRRALPDAIDKRSFRAFASGGVQPLWLRPGNVHSLPPRSLRFIGGLATPNVVSYYLLLLPFQ